MKKMLILLVVFLVTAGTVFASGSQDGSAPATEEGISVTMVTDVGGVNDQSFNQSAWEGL